MAYDLAVKSENVVTPDGVRSATILIENGEISGVADYSWKGSAKETIDAEDLTVMPGIVDAHVHVNEPGRTEWEGFETATKSAAAGGVTTIIDMPLNSIPVTTTAGALEKKIAAASKHLWVNVGLYGGVIPGNSTDLEPLIAGGVFGFKAFLCPSGIDEFPNATERDLRLAMPILARHRMPLLVHAELCPDKIAETKGDACSYDTYLKSRPRKWENDAIEMMIGLADEYECPVHIVHLSSSDSLASLARARKEGIMISAETCPHYLTLSAETIPDKATSFKCAPPIREKENQDKLWKGLDDGTIQFIAADHSPCTADLKLPDEGDFKRAWGGIASLQFELSVVWTEAKKREFTQEDLAHWLAENPSDFLGLGQRKGKIESGFDADFFIWNPEEESKIETSMIRHKNKVTPYMGTTLLGRVEQTFVAGKRVYADGELIGGPSGELLCRTMKH